MKGIYQQYGAPKKEKTYLNFKGEQPMPATPQNVQPATEPAKGVQAEWNIHEPTQEEAKKGKVVEMSLPKSTLAVTSPVKGLQVATKSPYERLIDAMYPDRSWTDVERENRREKARMLSSVIGDGISAIANLVGTSQYSTPFHNPEPLSERNNARLEKLRAERASQANQYLNAKIRLKEQERAERQRQAELEAEHNRWLLDYGLKVDGLNLQRDKFGWDKNKDTAEFGLKKDQFAHKKDIDNKEFAEKQRHNQTIESQGQQRIAIEKYNATKNGGSGGGKGTSDSIEVKTFRHPKTGQEYVVPFKDLKDKSVMALQLRSLLKSAYGKGGKNALGPYYQKAVRDLLNDSFSNDGAWLRKAQGLVVSMFEESNNADLRDMVQSVFLEPYAQ